MFEDVLLNVENWFSRFVRVLPPNLHDFIHKLIKMRRKGGFNVILNTPLGSDRTNRVMFFAAIM